MKKSPTPTHNKADYYTDAKRNPFKQRMTDAGRAKKHRSVTKAAIKRLESVLGQTGESMPRLLTTAAARLESVGKGNVVADFDFTADVFLCELKWCPGNVVTIDQLWKQLLALVNEFSPDAGETFARDFKEPFRWCVFGHVHRLNLEYDQRPDATTGFEIWRKGKQRYLVEVHRDGKRFRFSDPQLYRFSPWICHAGERPRHSIAVAAMEQIRRRGIQPVLAAMKAGKFRVVAPESELVMSDTLINVAPPLDLKNVRLLLPALSFKPSRNYRKT